LCSFSAAIHFGNSCLFKSTSKDFFPFSFSMSAALRVVGGSAWGSSPLPLCMKMKRIGGFPNSVAPNALCSHGAKAKPVVEADAAKKFLRFNIG